VIGKEPAGIPARVRKIPTSLEPPAASSRGSSKRVEQLATHPKRGSVPPELRGSRYRQIVEPPCRAFYRYDGERVFILHVIRGERQLRPSRIRQRDRRTDPINLKFSR
jgi:toxin ParE1/3/4